MTNKEYHERIDAALTEQYNRVTSSKEAADELIDSLGIRHLFIPMTKKEIKAAEKKRVAEQKRAAKNKKAI